MAIKDFRAARWEIEGVNGDTFTISAPDGRFGQEGVELAPGPKGFDDSPVNTLWTSSAFQEGADYRGDRVPARDLVFAANITGTPSMSMQAVRSRWSKAWSTKADSILRYTTPESGERSLKFRLAQQIEWEYPSGKDPRLTGEIVAKMTCKAGWPYYIEPHYVSTWTSTQDNQTGFVWVENPTPLPMWPIWVISAPGQWILPDFSWGNPRFDRAEADKDRMVQMPTMTKDVGLITVDTYGMNERVAAGDGSLQWARMRGVDFVYPVPPYTPRQKLPVHVTGPAGSTLLLRQRRNWPTPEGLEA